MRNRSMALVVRDDKILMIKHFDSIDIFGNFQVVELKLMKQQRKLL